MIQNYRGFLRLVSRQGNNIACVTVAERGEKGEGKRRN